MFRLDNLVPIPSFAVKYNFRFKADASGNGDFVYIDDVEISTCSDPSCSDGIQNQDETGVDCGGSCPVCLSDLIVQSFSAPVTAVSGSDASITYEIGNIGHSASGSFEIGIYLSDDNTLNTTIDQEVAILSRGSIGPGQGIVTFDTSVDIPIVPDGDYFMFFVVDHNDAINELLENNNSAYNAISITSSCTDGIQNGSEDNIDCGGDCAPCIEDCTNGVDDNNDGLVDCADLDCAGEGDCPCDHPDYDALIALYNATNGPTDWIERFGWNGETCEVCNWFGVSCNSDGRVRELLLLTNGLTGYVPGEINQLTEIERLFLRGDFTDATIPEEIGSLSQLTRLSLNGFTGIIPQELFSLTNLENLILFGGELSGSIPEEIGSLTTLRD